MKRHFDGGLGIVAVAATIFFLVGWQAMGAAQESGAPSSPQPGSVFRVGFYNLENYLLMDRQVGEKRLPDQPKPEMSKEAVVRSLIAMKADIIGLCEIGSEEDLADLQRRLKEAGADYPHAEHAGGDDSTRRLALLSKMPIISRDSKADLPYQLNGRIMRMQRGILDVTVEVAPQYPVRLMVVHLKSKRPVPMGEALMRRNEAQILRRHVSAVFREDPDVRLLVMGDLNDTKNEPPLQEVMGEMNSPTGLKDLPLADLNGEVWTHYWSTADLYSRIDFMLASQALERGFLPEASGIPHFPDWREGSDHRPLVAAFRVSP